MVLAWGSPSGAARAFSRARVAATSSATGSGPSAAASGSCASWRARAVALHPPPREAAGWSSAAAGLSGGAMPLAVVRAASWLEGWVRHAARPSPTNASKKAAIPAATSVCPLFLCQVLLEPALSVSRCRLYVTLALRRACSVMSRGMGSVGRVVCGGWVLALAASPVFWPSRRALAVFAHVSTH